MVWFDSKSAQGHARPIYPMVSEWVSEW
jgi:hypothetical protein